MYMYLYINHGTIGPGLPYRPLVHVNQGNLSVHTNVSESTYTD